MSDPLLTTLCSICRASPPKYKCPRCGIVYCSVLCNRRHRTRAGCNGIRDVTAFVSRERLQTVASLDSDYNFMHGIEVSISRNRKHMVEDRQVLQARDWQDEQQVQDHHHHNNNNKPKVRPVSSIPRDLQYYLENGSTSNGRFMRKLEAMCSRGDIELLHAPPASSRQRENSTNVAAIASRKPARGTGHPTEGKQTRSAHIRWQVEWLVYENGATAKPTRILRRQFDSVPVYQAYATAITWLSREQGRATVKEAAVSADSVEGEVGEEDDEDDDEKDTSKKKKQGPQRPVAEDSSFLSVYSFQDQDTGVWVQRGVGALDAIVQADQVEAEEDDEEALAAKNNFRFFLLQAQVPYLHASAAGAGDKDLAVRPRRSKGLIPIDAIDTLEEALRGRAVLEFPTIYVLPRVAGGDALEKEEQEELPAGHALASTARREHSVQDHAQKRTAATAADTQSSGASGGTAAKKRKTEHAADAADTDDDEDMADAESAVGRIPLQMDESETSSEGSTSEDDSDDGDASEEDDEGSEEEGEATEPAKEAVESTSNRATKAGLVVYDSWSEGSGDEAV